MRLIRQPDAAERLGDVLKNQLQAAEWQEFRAAVAFVKRSGVQHLADELTAFAARGGSVRVSVGIDLLGTSKEGLQTLLDSVSAHGGEVWIFHNADSSRPTFHPKVYLFRKPDAALLIIGSGNLTAGGLFTNYEANAAVELDLANNADAGLLREIEAVLDTWIDPTQQLARLLTPGLLEELEQHGLVQPETRTRGDEVEEAEPMDAAERAPDLFGSVRVPRPPALARRPARPRTAPEGAAAAGHRGFVMTLQQTDVGTGQTTPGTSRRSPEIFIPLAAIEEDRDFWRFPDGFREDATRSGKFDRVGVRMRLGGGIATVNMMTWPVKHDFRLRSEALRSAGDVGDILRLERAAAGSAFDYDVEIVRQGTPEYARRLAQCVRVVRPPSRKRFGYY